MHAVTLDSLYCSLAVLMRYIYLEESSKVGHKGNEPLTLMSLEYDIIRSTDSLNEAYFLVVTQKVTLESSCTDHLFNPHHTKFQFFQIYNSVNETLKSGHQGSQVNYSTAQ